MITTLTEDETFLDQSFDQASLRDHLRFDRFRDDQARPFGRHLRSFLNASDSEIAQHCNVYEAYDTPQITLALEECCRDWTLVMQGRAMHCGEIPLMPTWARFETRPGVFRAVVETGTWFYRLPTGQRRIFSLDRTRNDDCHCLTALCRIDDEPAALEDLRRLHAWIEEHHYLKGTTIDANGNRLLAKTELTWDDIALADEVRETVVNNVRQFLALRDVFARNGVPQRRGILLYGPPGNGKTLIGKVLRATEAATFMYLTAADADNAVALRAAFALARRLKPTILFLEDLDMYATDRRGSPDCRSLGEILAQLDGMQSNDGLMVIATTNDLTAIEPAIRERPSRFDVVLEIGPPDAAARRKILARRLAKTAPQEDDLLDEAVALTDGFSGAQVQEAAWRIIQHAILNGSMTADGIARPTQRDVEAVLPMSDAARVRRRVGFAEARMNTVSNQTEGASVA